MCESIVLSLICSQCSASLKPTDEHCPQCGIAIPGPLSVQAKRADTWWQQRSNVLAVLFLVLAVFGLFWLWKSDAFSTKAKWMWTVVVIVYTALLLWLTWLAILYLATQIETLQAI